MGWRQRLNRKEQRAQPGEVQFENALLTALLGGGVISKETALQVPTVAGGIDLIAGVVAGTPIKLYRDKDGRAQEVRNDARLRLLNDETGDTLNANEFWRAMVGGIITSEWVVTPTSERRGGASKACIMWTRRRCLSAKTATRFSRISDC